VLVSESEFAALRARAPARDLWDSIQDWRAEAAFDWPDLTPDEVAGWRDAAMFLVLIGPLMLSSLRSFYRFA
jgi:hypothetical protein